MKLWIIKFWIIKTWKKHKKGIKRYTISMILTFLTGFLGSLLVDFNSWSDLNTGILLGSLAAGFRLVLKSVFEIAVYIYEKYKITKK